MSCVYICIKDQIYTVYTTVDVSAAGLPLIYRWAFRNARRTKQRHYAISFLSLMHSTSQKGENQRERDERERDNPTYIAVFKSGGITWARRASVVSCIYKNTFDELLIVHSKRNTTVHYTVYIGYIDSNINSNTD